MNIHQSHAGGFQSLKHSSRQVSGSM